MVNPQIALYFTAFNISQDRVSQILYYSLGVARGRVLDSSIFNKFELNWKLNLVVEIHRHGLEDNW